MLLFLKKGIGNEWIARGSRKPLILAEGIYMADNRSKRLKLEAMANQDHSPEEAEIAKNLLQSLPPAKLDKVVVPPIGQGFIRIFINGQEIIVGDFNHIVFTK